MNLSIQGKFLKLDHAWEATVPILQLKATAPDPFNCLKLLCQQIKSHLKDQSFGCSFKVTDNFIFYVIVSNHQNIHEFIAGRMLQYEDPNKWEEDMKQMVKYEDNLEDKGE